MHAKLPCLQKGHWHLIFGAGLNAGRRLDRGEERDHAEASSHQQQPWSTRHRRGAASFPAQLLPGHGQAVVAMPGDPGKDTEVNQCREGEHPSQLTWQWLMCCSWQRVPPSHRSPARADTRHLRQRGGLLLWAGRWLDEGRTVEGLKIKLKEREIPPRCLPV